MKKLIVGLLALFMLLSLTACANNASSLGDSEKSSSSKQEEQFVEIKESPDKYTWYIKNYVGRNCASFGQSTSIDGGYRYEEYGYGRIKFIFIAEDNSFVDSQDKDSLKDYVVTAQSIAPNTELKLIFATYSDGTESPYSVEKQNIEEIELYVKRITNDANNP